MYKYRCFNFLKDEYTVVAKRLSVFGPNRCIWFWITCRATRKHWDLRMQQLRILEAGSCLKFSTVKNTNYSARDFLNDLPNLHIRI